MYLLIDNYDSFTYNLVHLVEKITHEPVDVFRNDEIPLEKVKAYDKIILSPGPGIPEEAGLLLPLIKEYAASKSILGVCLGHQAIAEAFGGSVVGARRLMHGKTSPVFHNRTGLYAGTKSPLQAMRYHSLIVERKALPAALEVTAHTADHLIMGLRHRKLPVEGVQFHPESIATPEGPRLLANFLTGAGV